MNRTGTKGTIGALDVWSGGWGKFSKYEIDNDRIRPARDAHFERYDPWEIYRKSRETSAVQTPYQSLMELASKLGAYRDGESGQWGYKKWKWDDAQRAQILSWCARFGLLGILPHIALSIDLPPRGHSQGIVKLYTYRGYIRINGEWTERRDDKSMLIRPPAQEAESAIPSGDPGYQAPSVLWTHEDRDFLINGAPRPSRPDPQYFQDIKAIKDYARATQSLAIQENAKRVEDHFFRFQDRGRSSPWTATLDHMIAKYFPGYRDDANKFECPQPLTPQFWQIYSEDLESFALYALMFVAAIQDPIVDRTDHFADPMNPGIDTFIAPIGISLQADKRGNITEAWSCPSLLSSFARMALQDLVSGGRVLRCECCRTPFISNAYQALYCSTKCGFRHRKRRSRTIPPKTKEQSLLDA